MRHLTAGAAWSGLSRDEERCIVLLRGEFVVTWAGRRTASARAPTCSSATRTPCYLPRDTPFRDRRVGGVRDWPIAARRPSRALAPRVIRPEDCGYEIRGGGNATRQIVDIVPPGFPADRLLICEVFTPGGNWSSYPPHKHDTDDPPREVDLEEIYYYRYQRSERATGSSALYDRPARRHAARRRTATSWRCATAITRLLQRYGYDAYYLNVLAGDAPVDGGERRSPLRDGSAAPGRRRIRGCRS